MTATKYDVWTTRDKRQIPVAQMTDTHLLHTIRAIEEGRIFPNIEPLPLGHDGACDYDSVLCDEQDERRENWLTVLKGEALKRGLDHNMRPTFRMDLVSWVLNSLGIGSLSPRAIELMRNAGITPPEIDVSNLDHHKPTYLHWKTGHGVGTPLEENKR